MMATIALPNMSSGSIPRFRSRRSAPVVPVAAVAAAEELPVYSVNPAYESVPHPEELTRRVVQKHEKKIKKDLKEAQKAEEQCALIKKILPDIYAQLNAACEAPRVERETCGPAALRREREEQGIEIVFKSKGIDQKALRQYLPLLLADYQRQMEAEAVAQGASANATTHDSVSRTVSEPVPAADHAGGLATTSNEATRPMLHHSATTPSSRNYDPDRLSVTAGYFESYTQKIYFSKRFVNLWKKNEQGKREEIAAGIAMVLVGLKLGLPMFDLFTFAVLDVPRLALQRFTGKQTLKLRD